MSRQRKADLVDGTIEVHRCQLRMRIGSSTQHLLCMHERWCVNVHPHAELVRLMDHSLHYILVDDGDRRPAGVSLIRIDQLDGRVPAVV